VLAPWIVFAAGVATITIVAIARSQSKDQRARRRRRRQQNKDPGRSGGPRQPDRPAGS
jgi:hypothetical protein